MIGECESLETIQKLLEIYIYFRYINHLQISVVYFHGNLIIGFIPG